MIDLLLIGPASDTAVRWSLGEVSRGVTDPRSLHAWLTTWIEQTRADALLCWDLRLGPPDESVAERLCAARGDVWHAGLLLDAKGQPGLIDFVAPNWMFNCDAEPTRESTSWRITPAAALIRTDVLRQLGVPQPEFDTLLGAMLEWGHRAISRGAIMRHVPDLIPRGAELAATAPTIADEVRFVAYRFSRFWARWATVRAAMTGYASAPAAYQAWNQLPAVRPYDEPRPYETARTLRELDPASKVTVLIPTLNRYPYLEVLLQNLREQTIKPHEVVVVDQTDRDNRDLTIAERYPDLPLRVMYQDSPGQCASRNEGLRASTGDYILLLDDDDELHPTLIEEHLRSLAKFDADVCSGVVQEVGTEGLPPSAQFARASDVFPAGNTLVRREVLRRSGLFDLAFNRAPHADGELGMRVYLSGAFMVLDQRISVIHHHAPQGGLRVHRARVVTYRMSREMLTKRNLPHTSRIYLLSRYFTLRQQREALWLHTFGTLSGRGHAGRRAVKALIGGVMLPYTIKEIRDRLKQSQQWLQEFPQIATLEDS